VKGFIGGALFAACVVVPWYVHWLRHRPHCLTEGTQHIVLAGLLTQLILFAAAASAWILW